MEMEKICIELPIVKVEPNKPIYSNDFAKEHYERGLFIVSDEQMHHVVYFDGECAYSLPCPFDIIKKNIIAKSIIDSDAIYHRDMEAIEDRLKQIVRLVGETKDEVVKSEARLTDTLMDERARQAGEFNILRDGLDTLEKGENIIMDFVKEGQKSGDNGANVLDVAKAFAVISKPELIKELNK